MSDSDALSGSTAPLVITPQSTNGTAHVREKMSRVSPRLAPDGMKKRWHPQSLKRHPQAKISCDCHRPTPEGSKRSPDGGSRSPDTVGKTHIDTPRNPDTEGKTHIPQGPDIPGSPDTEGKTHMESGPVARSPNPGAGSTVFTVSHFSKKATKITSKMLHLRASGS